MALCLPEGFDSVVFDTQMKAWVRDHVKFEQVLELAREQWPSLDEEYIYVTWLYQSRQLVLQQPPPINLERNLTSSIAAVHAASKCSRPNSMPATHHSISTPSSAGCSAITKPLSTKYFSTAGRNASNC